MAAAMNIVITARKVTGRNAYIAAFKRKVAVLVIKLGNFATKAAACRTLH